jgi:hypothetical protein
VSSGVEDQPGIKSADKIEKFVTAARLAALEQHYDSDPIQHSGLSTTGR